MEASRERAPITERLAVVAAEVEERLARAIAARPDVPSGLRDAIAHASLGGGKRLRPALVLAASRIFSPDDESAWSGALAVECIHVYSLVHDDLPCMDDDDLRRGRPTVHKVWGDAAAVLAGDGLQALAFELMAEGVAPDSRRIDAVLVLAHAAGVSGMVGGQQRDLDAEARFEFDPRTLDLETVRSIHAQKTTALIRASVEIGAVLGGAPVADRRKLAAYGQQLGLAFQIIDDCLDQTATSAELGKTAGKDANAGKATWPACVGLEASQAEAARLVQQARAELAGIKGVDSSLEFLDDLAKFVVDRRQ